MRRAGTRLWLIVALACALRWLIGVVLLGGMPLLSDAASHAAAARAMLESGGFLAPQYWPPGTTLFLAGLFALPGDDILAARLGVVAVGTVTVWLTYQLARTATDDAETALLASLLMALYPAALMRVGQPDSYPLATALLTAATWIAIRAWRNLRWATGGISGICLGLATLVRPSIASVAAFWLLLGGVQLIRSNVDRRRRAAVLAVAAAAWTACMLPIAWSNAAAGEGWVLSTNNELNFFLGNNPFTPNYKTGQLARNFSDNPADFQKYFAVIVPHGVGRMTLDDRRRLMHEAAAYIVGHPLTTALRVANRARAFWGVEYNASRQIQDTYALSLPMAGALLVLEGGAFFLIGFCALSSLLHQASWRGVIAFLPATMAAYAGPYVVSFATGLHHTALMPITMVLAASFVVGSLRSPAPWDVFHTRRGLVAAFLWTALQIEYLAWAFRYSGA